MRGFWAGTAIRTVELSAQQWREMFLEVAEIPHLGTGKVDLKGLKALALEKFCVNGKA